MLPDHEKYRTFTRPIINNYWCSVFHVNCCAVYRATICINDHVMCVPVYALIGYYYNVGKA